MGNLGGYQTVVKTMKGVGGPKRFVAIAVTGGYLLLRPAEAGVKKTIRAIKQRSAPSPTMGAVFQTTSDGDDGCGLTIRCGDRYQVLERDRNAILIEILGDAGSPYVVSSEFLRSISDFPQDDAEGGKES